MRKIFLIGILFFIFFSVDYTFAIGNEVETTKENISFIYKFLSTELLLNILFATGVFVASLVLAKWLSFRIEFYLEKKGAGESREEIIGVFTRVTNISILTLGGVIALGILGVDMGIFLGGFGFGLGFTLKIFLANFIAGIIMVTQGSYHNGDLIEIEGKTGKIRKINTLFTEVEQFDGVIFFVPNVRFLEKEVKNFNANDKRRVEIILGVDYDTDIVKAKSIIMKVLGSFEEIFKTPAAGVYIKDLGDNAILLDIRFWIDSRGEYLKMKSNVTETINLAFKQAGITIPFPQITLSNREDFKKSMIK